MVKSSSKAKLSKRYWWLSLEHCQHIKGWDRSQLNPTYTRRISLLSTPRPRLRLGLGLITMISYSWWGLTITKKLFTTNNVIKNCLQQYASDLSVACIHMCYLQFIQYHFCPFMIFISMQLMWNHSLQCLLSQRTIGLPSLGLLQ